MPNCLSPLMKYRCRCGVLAVSAVWLVRHRSLMIFTPRRLTPFAISTSAFYNQLLNICRVGVEAKPQLVVDGHLLLEKFETPFLYNTVLAEASDAIKQVSVTLDVETAGPMLEVSEDRKRVRWTRTRRSLPDTGKRFTDWECVLGSEGFTSGRHYWEVEVAGSERWSLGVAAESVERKGWVTLTPETGVWIIWRGWDDVFVAVTSPRSPLPARPIPGRVGVYLSYESGTVSFYDAATKSHLHTFTGNKFTEKLYPFFGPWDDKVKSSIQSLTKYKSGIQQMEQRQKEKISGVLEQSHNLQSKIKSQFAELHQILTEKEQRGLADIREEEKTILNAMEKNLREIEENLSSIQEELFKLQQQMDQKDNVVFLKSVVDGNLLIEKFETPFLYNTVLAEASDAIKQERKWYTIA
ncbi:zinc-binding protein A33-like [Rhinoraja longicauda]